MKRLYFFLVLAGIIMLSSCSGNEITSTLAPSVTEGPATGSLVIVGGAMKDTSIVNRFVALAGGADAHIVVIPTAGGEETIDTLRLTAFLRNAGVKRISVLHTYDSAVANQPDFVEPLKSATGVWFGGGRQWRIVDSYGGTLTETEIRKVLERGGVIGGSSAGATIQGSYLVRGDTRTNTIMMGDHVRGFGYVTNCAIDQHLLVRNRQHDLIPVIENNPELLGIGLDENSAIVVTGNQFEVIGASFVAVYDNRLWNNASEGKSLPNNGKFFLLRRGDKYDLKSREVINWSGGDSRNIFLETIPE